MAIKLFSLRGVPEDEADEIRELLDKNHVEYYETPAGNWGISSPAIWLRDEAQLPCAQQLIDTYQEQRLQRARAEYAKQVEENRVETVFQRFKKHPVQFILFVLLIIFILYISTMPFIDFGK